MVASFEIVVYHCIHEHIAQIVGVEVEHGWQFLVWRLKTTYAMLFLFVTPLPHNLGYYI